MKKVTLVLSVVFMFSVVAAQESTPNERRVSLSEAAVGLDSKGAAVLEAKLQSTALNGTQESPVTNVRFIVRNTSSTPYTFVSGVVTFYDTAGVRCGEGVFKAAALAADESFESDAPGIRIKCTPSTWRIVATNLVPRFVPPPVVSTSARLEITVDGEAHPLQLNKPITFNVGDRRRTIIVREVR
jgi:hypothetical protein